MYVYSVCKCTTLTILVVGFPPPCPAFSSILIISGLVCNSQTTYVNFVTIVHMYINFDKILMHLLLLQRHQQYIQYQSLILLKKHTHYIIRLYVRHSNRAIKDVNSINLPSSSTCLSMPFIVWCSWAMNLNECRGTTLSS